ncbi:AMP-binding protein [Nocardia aurantia]|uniref:2-succinylbenzoate--CoA ligase n=1 Tax=Nocardia aurantia TaxID=2585199 RepID=A0A7K0DJN6_9NOCA|nr:AMP-binding protein [Nocardia aurantia]MQY25791.1 2-succinylbenzoate--CoA ligase [Nocardia aurantia]
MIVPTTTELSPAARVDTLAAQTGRRVALVYEGSTYGYAALADQARRLAAVLAAGGTTEGDRVVYLGGNSVTFLTTFLAAARLGAVFVPVNSRLTAPEVAIVLSDCAPHTLVTEPEYRPVAEAASPGSARLLSVPGDPAATAGEAPPSPWETLPAAAGPAPEPVHCGPDRIAMLAYTSGTTGRPKGVELTHGNLWWNGVNQDMVATSAPLDVTLVVAPLFHTAPLGSFALRTLMRGGTVVLRRGFEAGSMLADLETYGVTTVFAVPAMFAAVAAHEGFAAADLSALRTAVTAGAPAPASLIERYRERGIALQQAYGLTETLFAAYLPADRIATHSASVGLPLPYTEIRIVDPAGDLAGAGGLPPGERGEVCVRAPTVARGYRGKPEATAEVFADGWFRTGDIGYLDPDGYLYLVDRRKDMIIVGGDNVYSAEVEQVLARFPDVEDVAVVGVPDEHEGESVVAIVTGRAAPGPTGPRARPALAELRRFAESELARYKLPTRVVHADRIPRNAMGKLDKPVIRAALADRDESVFDAAAAPAPTPAAEAAPAPASVADPAAPWLYTLAALPPDEQYRLVFDAVVAGIARTIRGGRAVVAPEDRLQDIGLGSLAAVELARRLGDTLRLRLPSTTLFDHDSVDALVRHLTARVVAGNTRPAVLDRLTDFERAVRDAPADPAVRAELRIRLRGALNRLAADEGPLVPAPAGTPTDRDLFALLDAELGPA